MSYNLLDYSLIREMIRFMDHYEDDKLELYTRFRKEIKRQFAELKINFKKEVK
jgi:hypothetical protein